MPSIISDSINLFRKYFLPLKENEFYEFNFVYNSPQLMTQELLKIPQPIVKHNKEKQHFTSKSPFVDGIFYYHKVSEDIYVVHSDLHCKENIVFKALYKKNIPCEYFCFALLFSEQQYTQKHPLVNTIVFAHKSWSVVHPGASVLNYQHKNTKNHILNVYVKASLVHSLFPNASLLHSPSQSLVWYDASIDSEEVFNKLTQLLINNQAHNAAHHLKIEIAILQFLNTFIEVTNKENENQHFLEDQDYIKEMLMARKMLLHSLLTGFPKIDIIAQKLGISKSTLSASFKKTFGKTMMQFYQEKQMQYAQQLIQKEELMVKQVAYLLNYSNATKFAQTFKKYIGCFPSAYN